MAGPARFSRADVVIVLSPYSDLSESKTRPALILAELPLGEEFILCQITSQLHADADSVLLTPDDFARGTLNKISNARPNRIFTAHRSLFQGRVGALKQDRFSAVVDTLVDILQR